MVSFKLLVFFPPIPQCPIIFYTVLFNYQIWECLNLKKISILMINYTIDPIFWFRDKIKVSTVCPHDKVRALLPKILNFVTYAMGWAAVVITVPYASSSLLIVYLSRNSRLLYEKPRFFPDPVELKEDNRGLAKKTNFLKQRCIERTLLHKPRIVLNEYMGITESGITFS